MTLGFWMSGVRLHLMPERDGKVGVMGTAYVPPSHRAIDLQAARRAEIAWAVVGQLIGALPALGGGAIHPFAP